MCFPEVLKDVAEQDVKKEFPELRAQAKTAKFALHYGGNNQTVARNLNISIEMGSKIEQAYLAAFPQIKNYFDTIKKQTYEQGYVLLSKVTGHKRFIYGINDLKELEKSFTPEFWNIYRKEKLNQTSYFLDVLKPKVSAYFSKKGDLDRIALNTPVQGTSAQITKLAGIYFFDYLIKHNLVFKVLIANCVHDEYVVETPKELSKEISLALQNSMEKAGKVFTSVVTLKAIPEISTYWKH